MIIEVSKIAPEGSRYEGEEPAEFLELEPGSGVEAEPLKYDLSANLLGQELMVQGRMTMPVRLQCVCCAVFFSTTVTNSSFLRVYPLHDGQIEVDVTADLREEIVLGLPSHPRCSDTCAGLCLQCGANLNHGSCTCAPREGPGAWDALEGLFRPGGSPPER